jgi:hypothetical protein
VSDQKVDGKSEKSAGHAPDKKDSISIVYHQRNDSPKYFEIKRSRVYLFFIGLPAITLIALVIGVVGLINASPFHLIESYRQNSKARAQIANAEEIEQKEKEHAAENAQLKSELANLQEQLKSGSTTPAAATGAAPVVANGKCPAPVICPIPAPAGTMNAAGLATLSLFKPLQGRQDRSKPAVLNLSGFKTTTSSTSVNLQFNIIPSVTDDSKISGHIIVLMKNEQGIEAYPAASLAGPDFQINYASGEPFATQRFRPVDASFLKPRKAGNYTFSVFIFSRTGDLIHFQTVNLPLTI